MAQPEPPFTLASHTPRRQPAPSPWVRNAKQFGFFLAGTGFMAASVLVTRRAVIRRLRESRPKFYVSNRHIPKDLGDDKQLLALHAFSLATLNVMSFGVMLVGGISWAFNLSSVEELRQRTKESLQRQSIVPRNPEDEKMLEEMMDDLLSKLGMQKPAEEKPQEPTSGETPPKG